MRFHTFVLKNVFRRRIRSTLTMTGVAIAVGAVVALVGIADGFSNSMLDLYQRRGVGLVVSRSDVVNLLGGALDERLGTEIAKLKGVESVCPGLVDVVSVENLQLNNIVMQGWPADAYMFQELTLLDGQRLSPALRGKHGVMLGRDLAGNAKLKVGDKVVLTGDEFTVLGRFESFSRLENNMLIMLLDDAQTLMGKPHQITGCTVRLTKEYATPEGAERVKAEIEGSVAAKLHLKDKIRAMPPDDLISSNTQIRRARAMAWVTSGVALAIGIILMLNTMFMSVFERTREIGILRAIGWQPRRVMRMILMESMLLSLGGAILGTLVGIAAIMLLSRLPMVNGIIQDAVAPLVISKAFLIALVVGLVGAAFPAYRGARLLPTEALRHE
jgi:putative ABC transport system permease protein